MPVPTNNNHVNAITKEMIAPCGLNCAVCKRALQAETPCLGCRGPKERKSHYCLNVCHIWFCEKLKDCESGFCDECPDYPCEEITEKEERYASQYPLKESPAGNLVSIRADGMEAFLDNERIKWGCPQCGALLCVHTGECHTCGYMLA